jgi:endogenous inhibitor of DNA gyrase (YacG/DUF329 family)
MATRSGRGGNTSCPICGSPSAPEAAPFCSERCRLRDLAHWIGGDEPYVIPGEPMAPLGAELSEEDQALFEEAMEEAGEGAPANVIRADFRRRKRLDRDGGGS